MEGGGPRQDAFRDAHLGGVAADEHGGRPRPAALGRRSEVSIRAAAKRLTVVPAIPQARSRRMHALPMPRAPGGNGASGHDPGGRARRPIMTYALWTVQALLAALFLFTGGMKLVMPIEAMTAQMPFPIPGWFLRFIGVAETVG